MGGTSRSLGAAENQIAAGEFENRSRSTSDRRVGLPRLAVVDRLNRDSTTAPLRQWMITYERLVKAGDLLVIVVVMSLAQTVRFGPEDLMHPNGTFALPAVGVSVGLGIAWLVALRTFQTYDRRILGAGTREFSRVAISCFALFGLLGILDLIFRLNVARGFLAVALSVGTLGLLAGRMFMRLNLRRLRARGRCLDGLLIVGNIQSGLPLLTRLTRDPSGGFSPVAICTPAGREAGVEHVIVGGREVPVYKGTHSVGALAKRCKASTVAVSSSDEFADEALRELSWDLANHGVHLLVSPGVVDISGPRMLVTQVEGLPLLSIDSPQYSAAQSLMKTSLDLFVATMAIIAVAPVMIATAVAIKLHDGGPVFFRQLRVGKDGQTFRVWKFRSMCVDADARKTAVKGVVHDEGRSVFFKSQQDPRITPVGAFIRKTSIDELPQLFNVLTREMSVVGPRPLVPGEGAEVPNFVERRLLVKPGMTGLWQVSGRSDLAEEDRIRLDLLYVENWSLMRDVQILWRTVKVVFKNDGAY